MMRQTLGKGGSKRRRGIGRVFGWEYIYMYAEFAVDVGGSSAPRAGSLRNPPICTLFKTFPVFSYVNNP